MISRSLALLIFISCLASLQAADQPQWGQAWTRNMVSAETGLPESFDPESGRNIKWAAKIGNESHSTPVVADGRVFVGTNNDEPRDPKHVGDRGVLMCFDEKDGRLLWQLVVPKRDEDPYFDWPKSGISSEATVDCDRVFVVSNRGEVICLDVQGMANGNDGPFREEGAHMSAPPLSGAGPKKPVAGADIRPEPLPPAAEGAALTPGPLDADIVWIFDMVAGAGIWPHDGAHSSILVHGPNLYLNTGTGVDNTHRAIRTPDAPSLIALEKTTGRLLARDAEGIAPNIFHCTWSSPSLATVGGKERLFFAAGDGIVRAFEPLPAKAPPGISKLTKVWQFDPDPTAPKERVHRFTQNKQQGPSNIYGMPVIVGDRLYIAGGGDVFWGKNEAWLKCVDATGSGDVTKTAEVWTYPLDRHTLTTAAVHDGLVFATDTSRKIHCVDAATGQPQWVHETKGDFWSSPFVADGKLFAGTRKGDFWVLAAAKEKRVLSTFDFRKPISATATAANGVLYIATMSHLYEIAAGAQSPAAGESGR